ncbi:U-box domain-containing protein 34-like isoform X1 [Zingiber officinale]|uniref:U-box domain-containing protein 34-like isoform X1 n=2 Tax=Zingiber officinale TaxID=94328 RepID=UPI001C4D60B2|nr:U-box domain-containing protein 34-like isoform X1 [Zingiber officinale]
MIATGGDSEAAIAVAVCGGLGGGRRSRRAVRWAADHLVPYARRVVLVHVIPAIASIPSPSGELVPVDLVGRDVVEMYVQDQKSKAQRVFFEFRRLCGTRNIDSIVLEGKDPASALLKYVSESGTRNLVLGCSSNWLRRILKGPDVPMTTLKYSSNICNIFVVSRSKLIIKFADRLVSDDPTCSSHIETISRKLLGRGGVGSHSYTWSDRKSFVSTYSETTQFSAVHGGEQSNRILSVPTHKKFGFLASIKRMHLAVFRTMKKSEPLPGVSKLKKELQDTIAKYHQVCDDLVDAKTKVHLLSTECSEDEKKLKVASDREEALKRIAAEERTEHLEAVKEVEEAKQFSSHMQEALERQKTVGLAGKVSFEKSEIIDAYFLNSNWCRRYSKDEIEYATDNFSEAKKIGEGSCGSVYKCTLDHTSVAVKVLLQNAHDKKEQFLREVEILSQLHHPHMLLLLGVCLENACLVYEYMENGSLEDQLFGHGKKPLPCIIRFRILYEVACGLAFLHGNKPEPIVHRDLKPANILLDRNYVSKIGDVGLARLLYDVAPDELTEYKETILAGTFFYMDPEYQRTGTIRPKSDIYAWGVIALQLLTGKHPNGLIVSVENAIKQGTFSNLLNPSITDWALTEAERLAKLALQCTQLRCRDRPDLDLEILPVLEDILNKGNTYSNLKRNSMDVPKHFFCPILQEVMANPYVAADGYTYEYRAIKSWLGKYDTSPVTELRFSHRSVIPNLSLRSAIQEWKLQVAFSPL